ncbi:MAG: hypothetical protein AAF532_10485, partial [Planctomycetota bacterium]
SPEPAFGTALLKARTVTERVFGRLACSSWGLTTLPPWVRRFRRVRPFVTAKLAIFHTASLTTDTA